MIVIRATVIGKPSSIVPGIKEIGLARQVQEFPCQPQLSQRFMIASLVILLAGMLGIGVWVEKQIETGVIHRTGVTTALVRRQFCFSPTAGIWPVGGSCCQNTRHTPVCCRVPPWAARSWPLKSGIRAGVALQHRSDRSTGKTYPMHEGLLRARLGEVVSEISSLDEEENGSPGSSCTTSCWKPTARCG